MIYTISNEQLNISVDSFGAELRSVRSASGIEYLWQGGKHYWGASSPVLFPYIARMYKKSYTYCGEPYSMGIHGFASKSEFTVEACSSNSITMVLRENDTTLLQYPFHFELAITYSLSGCTLSVKYKVKNMDSKLMPYALGAHPGFNVPFGDGTDFEDYYLLFDEPCSPVRIGFTEDVLLSGNDTSYPLASDRTIKLEHSLFDDDAIILKETSKTVSLHCGKTPKSLSMSFSGFDYFGIWHSPGTNAPYVCLEPWSSLPSRQGIIEELCEKEDLIKLIPGEENEHTWCLSISEE